VRHPVRTPAGNQLPSPRFFLWCSSVPPNDFDVPYLIGLDIHLLHKQICGDIFNQHYTDYIALSHNET
jgi:hypothetical protein